MRALVQGHQSDPLGEGDGLRLEAALGELSHQNATALEARFGSWPSFHDAEILALRLDSGQRSDGRVRLELDIHVFAVDGTLADGRFNFTLHTLVTLEFSGAESVELSLFGAQNVLDDLVLQDRDGGAAGVQVELPSSNGLEGSFSCMEVSVLRVEPFVPGPRSVYYSS